MDVRPSRFDVIGRDIYRIAKLCDPPEFVKAASHDTICGSAGNVPPHLYADQIRHTLPCHTKAATWYSAAFFEEQRDAYDSAEAGQIERRIEKSAEFFGIGPDVAQVRARIRDGKQASLNDLSDEDFALVWESDGGKERHLPLRNQHEVKAAANYLQQYQDEFVFDDRRTIAEKVLQKAATLGGLSGEQHEFLTKRAGYGFCTSQEAQHLVHSRLERISDATLRDRLVKLAAIAERHGNCRNRQFMHKLASAIDHVDRETHLNRRYDESLDRPEDVLFGITVKTAASVQRDYVTTPSGNIYPRESLARVKTASLRRWMGEPFVQAVTVGGLLPDGEKLAAAVGDLSRHAAERLDAALQENGIQPVRRDVARESSGITRDDLREIAHLA